MFLYFLYFLSIQQLTPITVPSFIFLLLNFYWSVRRNVSETVVVCYGHYVSNQVPQISHLNSRDPEIIFWRTEKEFSK